MKQRLIPSYDGTKISYLYHRGRNPLTLVFVHGVGANWTVWKKEIRYFQRKGYSTLALDLRGHGRSEAPPEFQKYEMPCFTNDIYYILQQERIKRFCLIGHSLGGAIALDYCILHKHHYPRSLILVESASTYPFYHNRLFNLRPYVTYILRFITRHKINPRKNFDFLYDIDLSVKGVKRKLHFLIHIFHLTVLRSIIFTLDNVEQYVFQNQRHIDATLRHLSIPTLVLAGELDRVIPVHFSEQIHRLDPRAVLRVLSGAHHRVVVEDPRQVSTVLYEFLKSKVE